MNLDEALASIPREWTAWELRSRCGREQYVCDISKVGTGGEQFRTGHGLTPVAAVLDAISKLNP